MTVMTAVKFYINKILSALISNWTTSSMKEIVVQEGKRIFKKVFKAVLFVGIWRGLEKSMEKNYRNIAEINKELELPDEDFDPRDLENFIMSQI